MVTWTRDFTQVRALLMEVKPYSCLIIFDVGIVQSTCIYHETVVMNIRLSIDWSGLGLYNTPEA